MSLRADLRPVNNRRAPHELVPVKVTAGGGGSCLPDFAFKIQSSESRPQQRDIAGRRGWRGTLLKFPLGRRVPNAASEVIGSQKAVH